MVLVTDIEYSSVIVYFSTDGDEVVGCEGVAGGGVGAGEAGIGIDCGGDGSED